MVDVSRRRFLKIGAATSAAALAATAARPELAAARAGTSSAGPRTHTVPTFCDVCFWKCGAIAHVRDGELWKVDGHPDDPLSRGRLCPRGTGGGGARSDPDRLRTPLMRKHKRGQEEWVSVSWDEALTFIAERMDGIRQQHGPEAMALFSHGIGGTFLKHMFRAWGSPNLTAPSYAQCRGPRDVGFELTFGEGVGSPERTDIENARCLVLLGSHLGENMHNTQVQEFAEAIGRRASIIVVDPRFSVAAGKAQHYLPIKPGTDLALLLAWMHVLVTEKLYDEDYIRDHGFGFDAFAASLAAFTPEWAYPETGITPEVIRATAREMARCRPATLVHPGRHVTWYGDDAQRSRAIALLNALLGSWGRKGGFYAPSAYHVPAYPYPAYPKPQRDRVDNPEQRYPFASGTLTTGIRQATLSGEPYPIKGWMVYATNLLKAMPAPEETIAAIQQLDLMVVVDVVPSEIAGWADVVLPESVYLERYDELNTPWFRDPFVALRQPVLEPPQEQKANWWIARELGLKLGLAQYFPWQDVEQYLDTRLRGAGLTLAQLQQQGVVRGQRQPLYFDDGAPAEFFTPSGRIEFYSPQLAAAGFDPVPRFTPPEEPPTGMFRLLYGRAPVHSFSRTQTNPLLAEMMDENHVWLNASIAARMGLRTGDRVRLRNQDGVLTQTVPVLATERIRPDCVYMVHGFGHTARGFRQSARKGASDAELMTRYQVDPLMGGTGMNVNFVGIEV